MMRNLAIMVLMAALLLTPVAAYIQIGDNIEDPTRNHFRNPAHHRLGPNEVMVFNAMKPQPNLQDNCYIKIDDTLDLLLAQNGIFTSQQLNSVNGPLGIATRGARNKCNVVKNPQNRPYLHNAIFVSASGDVFPKPYIPVMTTPTPKRFNPMGAMGFGGYVNPLAQVQPEYLTQPSTYQQSRVVERQFQGHAFGSYGYR